MTSHPTILCHFCRWIRGFSWTQITSVSPRHIYFSWKVALLITERWASVTKFNVLVLKPQKELLLLAGTWPMSVGQALAGVDGLCLLLTLSCYTKLRFRASRRLGLLFESASLSSTGMLIMGCFACRTVAKAAILVIVGHPSVAPFSGSGAPSGLPQEIPGS